MASPWKAIFSFDDIVGESEGLQEAVRMARHAAEAGYPTLIVGESGTGKELFAHAIHNASVRREGPFVAVNCGTVGGDLAAATLCGYEAHSFTGADRHARKGILETARGGTLFLDELQDLPSVAQSVLLRFLETGTFVRVGGTHPVHSSVRIIAASNIPVEELKNRGIVRADLLYRLDCLVIEIPPLRERLADIRPIGEKCLRGELHFAGEVDEKFWPALETCPCPWPGNARSLRNVLLKAMLKSTNGRLTLTDLPAELWALRDTDLHVARHGENHNHEPSDGDVGALKAVLTAAHDNVSETARRLGIHRSTVYRRLARATKFEPSH